MGCLRRGCTVKAGTAHRLACRECTPTLPLLRAAPVAAVGAPGARVLVHTFGDRADLQMVGQVRAYTHREAPPAPG